jgi:ABC-2 type transport system permease protein
MFNRISAINEAASGAKDPAIGYYAGAIAIMFLLFSAMHSAALSLEERETQIPHRLSLQFGRYLQFTGGKFLFLCVQGTLQSAVILIVAALIFGIPVMNNIELLAITSLAMAAAAAGIALLVTSLCRTPAQAHTVSTFLVLISSAIGGSMVPRFMMPDWLQSAGFATPNTWAIEAVYGILVRGEGLAGIFTNCAILFAIGLVCYIVAVFVNMRQIRRS